MKNPTLNDLQKKKKKSLSNIKTRWKIQQKYKGKSVIFFYIERGYSNKGASWNINVRVIIHIYTIVKNSFIIVLNVLKNIFCKICTYS